MGHYLMQLTERSGEQEFTTNHLIEAEDRQMVKYHFHRTLKDFGYSDTQWEKHCLESWDLGLQAEIYNIVELDNIEWQVLNKYLHRWTKV